MGGRQRAVRRLARRAVQTRYPLNTGLSDQRLHYKQEYRDNAQHCFKISEPNEKHNNY